MIVVSLPITWAATWSTASGITGLTFPGMIDEPFWSAGRVISASPVRGPEAIQRRSLEIFVKATAVTLNDPDTGERVAGACTAKWSTERPEISASTPGVPCATGSGPVRRIRGACSTRCRLRFLRAVVDRPREALEGCRGELLGVDRRGRRVLGPT